MPKGEDEYDPKKCSCGSGLEKDAEYDARGIFLTYACDKCREQKLGSYRSEGAVRPELLGRRSNR